MSYIKSQLETKFAGAPAATKEGPTQVVVHAASSFEGYYTYDGIDVCGMRVANEIQEQVTRLQGSNGDRVVKLSVVGYSLGGLISRYALGLLYQRGLFDEIEPAGFTTFASPHAGARTLGTDPLSRAFNFVASYFLAYTSRQLFLTDAVKPPAQDPGAPKRQLLLCMADPQLPFYKALALFKSHTLYANVVNDHRTEWYTAGINEVDPYMRNSAYIRGAYMPGYGPIVLDYARPLQLAYSEEKGEFVPFTAWEASSATAATNLGLGSRIRKAVWRTVRSTYMLLHVGVVIPVWFVCSVLNSAFQAVSAWFRKRHFLNSSVFSAFKAIVGDIHIPSNNAAPEEEVESTMAEKVSEHAGVVLESVLEAVNYRSEVDLPALALQKRASASSTAATQTTGTADTAATQTTDTADTAAAKLSKASQLNLSPVQRTIITNLNKLGWAKYPVHIRHSTHSHAAIICRFPAPQFEEGKVVVRHWVEEVFRA